MNTDELKELLAQADSAFIERTGKRPYCDSTIHLYQNDKAWEAYMWARNSGPRTHIRGAGETPENAVRDLINLIAKEPSAEDQALHDFQYGLGKLIDQGRLLGVDVKFLNPITELAREIAKNALTHETEK